MKRDRNSTKPCNSPLPAKLSLTWPNSSPNNDRFLGFGALSLWRYVAARFRSVFVPSHDDTT